MTSDEETKSNTEREDSNQVYVKNPQEKEDIVEATSKDQESESTQTESDPLLPLISPDLRATILNLLNCSPNILKP